MAHVERFAAAGPPAVRGFLHAPETPSGTGLVLAHGAGSDCRAPVPTALASAFAAAGVTVLRCDLPFRQRRPHGPPMPDSGPTDREGLRQAIVALRTRGSGDIYLGGHSYGGRQASMLAAEAHGLARALLLLSYPLHPPGRPDEGRTGHFPSLTAPVLFVHGSRDPFATREELERARALIPAPTEILEVDGAAHDLARLPTRAVVEALFQLARGGSPPAGVSADRCTGRSEARAPGRRTRS